jgi:cellulose synthase operon protein C
MSETWTKESVQQFLAQQKNARQTTVTSVDPLKRQYYLQSAAVLSDFHPTNLKPFGGHWIVSECESVLEDDMIVVPGFGESLRTLRPASREAALSQFHTREEMWSARQRNPSEGGGDLQAAIDWLLSNSIPPLETLQEAQLAALLQATRWFGERVLGLPAPNELSRRLVRKRLTSRFERLAIGFVGRVSELGALREYVGVLAPATMSDSLKRGVRSFFGDEISPPLVLHGIGGIGKSSLLAKFILEHVESNLPFPFTYLDFDNRFLDVEDISTLVGECLAQLEAQYPEAASIWAPLHESLASYSAKLGVAETPNEESEGTLSAGGSAGLYDTQMKMEDELAEALGSALRTGIRSNLFNVSVAESALPFVLVLDTFEEVQKRSERAERLWRFLGHLQRRFPRLRLIIAGRSKVPNLKLNDQAARNMELGGFDLVAATSILEKLGVQDAETRVAIFRQLGGNPLSLRLAAQVYREGGAGSRGIVGLKTTSYLLFSASQAVIQGQLYRRILEHITDLDVRRLAHPGLVVRRITPEVIWKVLSIPCGLAVEDEATAQDLFHRLRRQVDLVEMQQDGSLVHRPDVRAIMLSLLKEDRPDQVAEIHRAAVAYYHDQSGAVARGEELYHLLQLDSDYATLDAAWTTDAERFVLLGREELPPRAQVYVARRTNTDLDPTIRAQADLEEWEALTESKVRELIRLGGLTTAQMMLGERKERSPGSSLYPLEATVLILMKNYKDAEKRLEEGIASVESTDRLYPLLEMVRVRGDLYSQTGRLEQAEEEYSRAEALAQQLGKGILQLQILVNRVTTRERIGKNRPEPTEESMEYLRRILDSIRDSDLAASRGQLSGLFRTLGPDYPDLLKRGLKVFSLQTIPENLVAGFPSSTSAKLSATDTGRACAHRAASELAVPYEQNPLGDSAAPWLEIMKQAHHNQRLNEFAGRVLAELPADKELRQWLSNMLEAAIGSGVQPAQALGVSGGVSYA